MNYRDNCPKCHNTGSLSVPSDTQQDGKHDMMDVSSLRCDMCDGVGVDFNWVLKRDSLTGSLILQVPHLVDKLLEKAYTGHLEYKNGLDINYSIEVPQEIEDAVVLIAWQMTRMQLNNGDRNKLYVLNGILLHLVDMLSVLYSIGDKDVQV